MNDLEESDKEGVTGAGIGQYEWDSQHGTVEKYDKKGRHLGEFDPDTGKPTNLKSSKEKLTMNWNFQFD